MRVRTVLLPAFLVSGHNLPSQDESAVAARGGERLRVRKMKATMRKWKLKGAQRLTSVRTANVCTTTEVYSGFHD